MARFRNRCAALALAVLGTAGGPLPAVAYQIDCAILLCMGGGFPSSAPCLGAKAEMIRRITPWPIEPPLQIWRCPMRASYRSTLGSGSDLKSIAARFDRRGGNLTSSQAPFAASLPDGFLQRIAEGDYSAGGGKADIDISNAAYDFVRSIRVFSVEYARQGRSGGDSEICRQSQRIRLGTYGRQGDFFWSSSSVGALPAAFRGVEGWERKGASSGDNCPLVSSRAVFIEWRDHAGAYGSEQVNY